MPMWMLMVCMHDAAGDVLWAMWGHSSPVCVHLYLSSYLMLCCAMCTGLQPSAQSPMALQLLSAHRLIQGIKEAFTAHRVW